MELTGDRLPKAGGPAIGARRHPPRSSRAGITPVPRCTCPADVPRETWLWAPPLPPVPPEGLLRSPAQTAHAQRPLLAQPPDRRAQTDARGPQCSRIRAPSLTGIGTHTNQDSRHRRAPSSQDRHRGKARFLPLPGRPRARIRPLEVCVGSRLGFRIGFGTRARSRTSEFSQRLSMMSPAQAARAIARHADQDPPIHLRSVPESIATLGTDARSPQYTARGTSSATCALVPEPSSEFGTTDAHIRARRDSQLRRSKDAAIPFERPSTSRRARAAATRKRNWVRNCT